MDRQIFLHIGLHKTGTSFLQWVVFAKWQDIVLCRFESLNVIVKKLSENKPVLISNEGLAGSPWDTGGFDNTSWHEKRKKCLRSLRILFLNAQILISFRKHSGLILSLYKQYLAEGGYISFEQFFDIENNKGLIKREDLIFTDILDEIRKNFKKPIFVFTQEQIRNDLGGLLKELECLIGGKAPSLDKVLGVSKNVGVGYYQAKILRVLNRFSRSYLNPRGILRLNNKFTTMLHLNPGRLCQNRLAFLSKKKLTIPKEIEDRISDYYKEDWANIEKAVRARAEVFAELQKNAG